MGVPYAPPPPPPPAWAAALPTDPLRSRTYRAVQRIQTSLTIYTVVPLLTLVYTALAATIVLATGAYVVGNYGGSGISGLIESSSAAIEIAGEIVAFGGFILTIVAWLTWRGGVKELNAASSEYGAAHQTSAHQAERDYSFTVYTWIATFLFGIALAVVLVLLILGTLLNDVNNHESASTAAANALSAYLVLLIVVAVVTVLLTFLLYFFASRSLMRSLASIASPGTKSRLERARSVILVGAILGILAEATLATAALYVLAIVGPVLLVIGFLMMRSAYGEWLRAPTPLSPAPPVPETLAFPSGGWAPPPVPPPPPPPP
jgi:uncharacterized membrane protein